MLNFQHQEAHYLSLIIFEVCNIASNYRKYHQIISKFGIYDKASLRSKESLTNNLTGCWPFDSQYSGAISHVSTESLWSRRVQYHDPARTGETNWALSSSVKSRSKLMGSRQCNYLIYYCNYSNSCYCNSLSSYHRFADYLSSGLESHPSLLSLPIRHICGVVFEIAMNWIVFQIEWCIHRLFAVCAHPQWRVLHEYSDGVLTE